MSKRSKERRRRLQAEAIARQQINSGEPVTGNMEHRVTVIANEEKADKQDSQIVTPVTYVGNGHYVSQSQQSQPVDVGYRPINYESDKKVFNVISDDIIKGECPIAKIPKVYVTTRLWNEWIALAEDYNTEWLAYLTGQFVKDDHGARYEIRKMYFPPQVAHAAHVEVDDDFEGYQPNTIGAIHSHVQMGVFFSGEDLAHSNWPVEIVVNAKGEVKVMIRHQLECGQWIKNYSEVMTVGDAADQRYVSMLDKAFDEGESLRQMRLKKKQSSVGYRTPEVSTQRPLWANPPSRQQATYDSKQEWHFQINGRPHKWRDGTESGTGDWVEVVKVNGTWIYIDDPSVADGQSVADATGDSTDAKAADVRVVIDQETGQVIMEPVTDDGSALSDITRPATTEELDRMMEAEVDAASCFDCGGTGRITANGANIECTGCGGSGLKPGYHSGMGWEGMVC